MTTLPVAADDEKLEYWTTTKNVTSWNNLNNKIFMSLHIKGQIHLPLHTHVYDEFSNNGNQRHSNRSWLCLEVDRGVVRGVGVGVVAIVEGCRMIEDGSGQWRKT